MIDIWSIYRYRTIALSDSIFKPYVFSVIGVVMN